MSKRELRLGVLLLCALLGGCAPTSCPAPAPSPADVPLSECRNADCPIGCPDSHCGEPYPDAPGGRHRCDNDECIIGDCLTIGALTGQIEAAEARAMRWRNVSFALGVVVFMLVVALCVACDMVTA